MADEPRFPAHDDPATLFWVAEVPGRDRDTTTFVLRDSYGGIRPASRAEVAFWLALSPSGGYAAP